MILKRSRLTKRLVRVKRSKLTKRRSKRNRRNLPLVPSG